MSEKEGEIVRKRAREKKETDRERKTEAETHRQRAPTQFTSQK